MVLHMFKMSAHRRGHTFPGGIFPDSYESIGCYQILVVTGTAGNMAPRRPDFLGGEYHGRSSHT
jgi:hypothetical protein